MGADEYKYLVRVKKDIKYDLFSDLEIVSNSEIQSFNLPSNKRFLKANFEVPPQINSNIRGIGDIMLEDGFKYHNTQNPLDGFFGIWSTSDNYVAFGGQSVNLSKFKQLVKDGMSPELAALETFTGRFMRDKGFTKVTFIEKDLIKKPTQENIESLQTVYPLFEKP